MFIHLSRVILPQLVNNFNCLEQRTGFEPVIYRFADGSVRPDSGNVAMRGPDYSNPLPTIRVKMMPVGIQATSSGRRDRFSPAVGFCGQSGIPTPMQSVSTAPLACP